MPGRDLKFLLREELEAEIVHLRTMLKKAGIDAYHLNIQQDKRNAEHRSELATSREETAQANRNTREAQADAQTAARDHQRRMDGAAADLATSEELVSALQASQDALARSEARQRAIFENAIDFAIIVTDLEGIITDWNPGAERVLGWTAEEMRGQDAERFFTPEDRASGRVAYEMQWALRDGRAPDERWHLRKSDERFWASGEMMPLRKDDGRHIGFFKILRDRTAEHLAGVALTTTQERYRLASKATNDAIWDWDFASNHVLWNEALTTAYGHLPENVAPTGDWWIAHIHPEDRERIDVSIHAVIDGTGSTWIDEYRFLREDGSYAQVLDRGHVLRDDAGRACRMIGAMLDLTRLRGAEAAVLAGQAQLKAVLDTVPVGILMAEAPTGRIILGNQRLAQILGHETLFAADAEEYEAFVAYHPDGRRVDAAEYPLVQITSGRCDRAELEVHYQRPSGQRVWIAITGEAIKDTAGNTTGAVVAVADIDARKRGEEHQDVLNRELSHRLKNTLAIVQAIATQTLRNAPNIEVARDALGARLIALGKAHDILLTGRGVSADMQAVITGALELHDDAGHSRFVLDGPALLVKEQAALSLSLMVHELATNATKYGALSGPGGSVRITWSVGGAPGEKTVQLTWQECGGPPVTAPTHKGFGSRLIARGLAGAVGGQVLTQYLPEGVVCTLTAPLTGLNSEALTTV